MNDRKNQLTGMDLCTTDEERAKECACDAQFTALEHASGWGSPECLSYICLMSAVPTEIFPQVMARALRIQAGLVSDPHDSEVLNDHADEIMSYVHASSEGDQQ